MRRFVLLCVSVAMLLWVTVPAVAVTKEATNAGVAQKGMASSSAAPPDGVRRLAGSDRIATAVAISQAHFGPDTRVAYVARADAFPDALAAGPLAGQTGGPILLAHSSSLPASTFAELRRLAPDRIVVLGGTGAISQTVANQLAGIAPVERIAGSTRFETAAAIAQRAADTSIVYLATGHNYPDALAIGAIAGAGGHPIMLAGGPATWPPGVQRVIIVGGTGAVSSATESALRSRGYQVSRIAGAGRYETAAAILRGAPRRATYTATGANFPDALTVTPAAVVGGASVSLSPQHGLTRPVGEALLAARITSATIVGGTGAVADTAATQLRQIIDGIAPAYPTPTPPDPCPSSRPGQVSAAQATQCLYASWKRRDENRAMHYAAPMVVAWLFRFPWTIEWEWLGCEPGGGITWPSGTVCGYYEPAPGYPHGVLIEFLLEDGWVIDVATFG